MKRTLGWFQRYRMDWIAEMLMIYGYINRAHLESKFGISTPQASVDLKRFAKLHPRTMTYDVIKKRYVAVEV